jgi:hypothetical protein
MAIELQWTHKIYLWKIVRFDFRAYKSKTNIEKLKYNSTFLAL